MAQQTFSGVPGDFTPGEVLTASDMDKLREFILFLIKDGDETDTGEVSPLIIDLGDNTVGIGTDAPDKPIHIVTSSGDAYVKQYDGTVTTVLGPDGSSTALWGTTSNHPVRIITNDAERFRIDTTGLITSPRSYSATTGNSANLVVYDSGGGFYRSTSSAKYKTDVETMEDEYADAILNLRPVWYRSNCDVDNKEWSHWGFIAEEVEEIDPRLVFHDEDGTPESVQYDRVIPALINVIQRLEARVTELENCPICKDAKGE